MASRIFLCLEAACCCLFCLALLLPPPLQGRRPGLAAVAAAGGLAGGRRRLHLLPAITEAEPRFFVPTEAAVAAEGEERRGVPVTTKKARPAAWSVTRPELREVPGGPDPLHHHGGSPSRRPEPEQDRTPSSP